MTQWQLGGGIIVLAVCQQPRLEPNTAACHFDNCQLISHLANDKADLVRIDFLKCFIAIALIETAYVCVKETRKKWYKNYEIFELDKVHRTMSVTVVKLC